MTALWVSEDLGDWLDDLIGSCSDLVVIAEVQGRVLRVSTS